MNILAYLEKIGLLIISSFPENPQPKIITVEKQFLVELDIFRILSCKDILEKLKVLKKLANHRRIDRLNMYNQGFV